MGYKLAGFEVVGCCEVDPAMMQVYRLNHKPALSYQQGVQSMNKWMDFPTELAELDILDGSPPCSSFSFVGSRHRAWGLKKKFREGQTEQVLDDLFFDFIDLAGKLRPKVVVAENVKALVQGKARGYCRMIFDRFRERGYEAQLFLLNAASMGVPQVRERTFFVARRADLKLRPVKLGFNESPIPVSVAIKDCAKNGQKLTASLLADWQRLKEGLPKRYHASWIAKPGLPCPTLSSKVTTGEGSLMHYEAPRKFSNAEVIAISTFPLDFNFNGQDVGYIVGMAVPPFMMQRISHQLARQLF